MCVCICVCVCVSVCVYVCDPYHIDQLGDLEAEAHPDGVIGVLDGPDPALVALEQAPEEVVLHHGQGHGPTWGDTRRGVNQ